MKTSLGLFYAKKLENFVHCAFLFTLFVLWFCKSRLALSPIEYE